MVLTASFNLIGLAFITWAAKTTFAQISNCTDYPWQINASTSYNTTITSPNYPEYYDFNLECNWLIEVDSNLSFHGYIVKVTFNDFWLEMDDYEYCADVLRFYDGMDKSTGLLGSYCGFYHPEVIYSTGQYLYVQLRSTNGFLANSRFSFNVLAVKGEEASGICRPLDGSTVFHLSGTSGTFFSPDYPVPYPDGARCIWTISVPPGKRVKLVFEGFRLEDDDCKHSAEEADHVQIRSGQDSESKELALICDHYPVGNPPDVYSTGSHLWVKFYSILDGWSRWSGFKARFEAVDPPPTSREECFAWNIYNDDLKLSGLRGTLQSPQEPHYFPLGPSCDWLITVPKGNIVKLSFEMFELEPSIGSTCTAEYVEVLDGSNSNSESIGRFCGLTAPGDIRSSGRFMRVVFRSDSEYPHFQGFKATFTAEDKPTSSTLIIAIVVSVVVFIGLVCCVVCVVKRRRKPSDEDDARIPMTTTTNSEYPRTQTEVIQPSSPTPVQPPNQPAANPYPPPPVGYAPVPTNPSFPAPPPPYPGDQPVPQYPPPGQSYPWLQSEPANASSPPEVRKL